MNRLMADIHGLSRSIFILVEYLIWLIVDFSKFKRIDYSKIDSVVIIHLGAFGEVLASTPIIKKLKEEGIRVHYMIKGNRSEVLEDNPDIDGIINYSDDSSVNLENLKKTGADLAIILWPGSISMSLLCSKAGIKYCIGCFRTVKEGLSLFYNRRVFPLHRKHAVMENVSILKLIGLRVTNPRMHFCLNNNCLKKIKNFLSSKNIKNFAVIHPGFGGIKDLSPNMRLWPPERYATIADYLISKGFHVIITGMDNERLMADAIINNSKNKGRIVLTNGLFNFKEQAALLSISKLLIAPDTGIVHLASAIGCKVVDLMSRTDPQIWRPWADKNNYRVLIHPEGFTYYERFYSDNVGFECMKKITVDEVKKAVDELLRS